MRVLIPELAEDAATIAAALIAQGHEVLAIPAITVAPSAEATLNLAGAQAFLVASPVAARALAARLGVRTFPVFADSAVTADTLRRLGFNQVEAANDTRELANIVGNRLKPATGALIHPCATGTPSNLTAVLTNMGFAVRALPLYTLTRIDTAPPELRAALTTDSIDAAVFTTAEAARALVTVLQRSELSEKVRGISALAATTSVAATLRGLNLASITVPEPADEAGLVAAMATVVAERAKAIQAMAAQEQQRLEAERTATQAVDEERRRQETATSAEQERKRLEAERETAAAVAAQEEQRQRAAAEAAEQERKRVQAEQQAAAARQREEQLETERVAQQAAEAERLEALRRADEEAARARREAAARQHMEWMRQTAPPEPAEPSDGTSSVRVSSQPAPAPRELFVYRIGRWLRRWKDQEALQEPGDNAGGANPPAGTTSDTDPIPATIPTNEPVNLKKPGQDDLPTLPSSTRSSLGLELTVPEPPSSVRLDPRPLTQTEPLLPLTPPGAMTNDQKPSDAETNAPPAAPAATSADAPADTSPTQRGRAARLQAEDAADAVRAPRWRGFADAGDGAPSDKSSASTDGTGGDAPRDTIPEMPAPQRSVRMGVVVAVLVIFAVAATAPVWLPRLELLRHGPEPTPVNTVVVPPQATTNDIAAPRQALEQTPAPANAETPSGDAAGNQATQMAALTARVATLETALGNTARLDELNQRLTTLEGKSAEAASVLALADRVAALESASRGAIAAQTSRVALVLAIAQWRDALAEGRPFALELESVKALADRAVEPLAGLDDARFASRAPAGIATTAMLRERFDDTAGSVLRAAAVPGGFNGLWGRSVERMMSIVTIRRVDGLVAGNTPSAILARAGAYLKDGNLAAAVTEMEQLNGSAAAAAQPWLDEARARVAAEQAVAAATNTALGALAALPTSPSSSGPGSAPRDTAPTPQ